MNESTRVCERRRLFAPPSHHHVVAAPDSPERWRYGNVSEEMASLLETRQFHQLGSHPLRRNQTLPTTSAQTGLRHLQQHHGARRL